MARPGVGLNRHVETLCSSQQLHWIQGACYTLEILRAGDSHKKGLFSRSLGFKSVLIHTDTSVNFIYGAIDIIHINSSTPFTLSNNMHLILIGCRYKLLMEWRWSGSGVEVEWKWSLQKWLQIHFGSFLSALQSSFSKQCILDQR